MISPNGITTIIFDLDGTLRHSVPTGHEVFWEFAASLGAPNGDESRRKAVQWANRYWADSEDLLIDMKTFGKGNKEFWANYAVRQLTALGFPPNKAKQHAPDVHTHMSENYKPTDVIPDDVPETLDWLREHDFTVRLVTNRSDPIDEYMEKTELVNHLDFYFTAGEIGTWKPKPEIFYYALGMANAKPEQAAYVGDNYYADVVGARAANIQPILIDPHDIFPEADCPTIQEIGQLKRIFASPPPS